MKYVDPWGLSERDVKIIIDGFNKTVSSLNLDGSRRAGTGKINGILNNLNYWCQYTGCEHKGYSGCFDQASIMMDALKKMKNDGIKFDDKWRFHILTTGLHNWVAGYSSDPNDGFLTLDPWSGETSQSSIVPVGLIFPKTFAPTDNTVIDL